MQKTCFNFSEMKVGRPEVYKSTEPECEREREMVVWKGEQEESQQGGALHPEAFTSVGPPLLPLHVKPGGPDFPSRTFFSPHPRTPTQHFAGPLKPSNVGVKRQSSLRVLKGRLCIFLCVIYICACIFLNKYMIYLSTGSLRLILWMPNQISGIPSSNQRGPRRHL